MDFNWVMIHSDVLRANVFDFWIEMALIALLCDSSVFIQHPSDRARHTLNITQIVKYWFIRMNSTWLCRIYPWNFTKTNVVFYNLGLYMYNQLLGWLKFFLVRIKSSSLEFNPPLYIEYFSTEMSYCNIIIIIQDSGTVMNFELFK